MHRRWNILGWSILVTVFIGMVTYLILNPSRTGVVPNYRMGATNWWAGKGFYGVGPQDSQGTHGFLYFPQFAVLFSLFNLIRPELLGEILWRAFGLGLFAWGIWKLANANQTIGRSGANAPTFLPLVVLSVPASLASINNGQTNLPLSGCLVLAVIALGGQTWNLAAFWLGLALVLKPIALAPWLLAFAVFPAMRRPLLISLVPLGVLGLLHPDLHYATDRWSKCLQKIFIAYSPENLRVSDMFGALGKAGWAPPAILVTATRAMACLGVLAWVGQSFRRQGLAAGSWTLWVASALVWTLFNPRAETNSYVLISPLLAFAAISYWQEAGGRWKGLVLAAACLGLMCDGMGLWIYKATDVWFKPLIVLLVSPLLMRVPRGWKREGGSLKAENLGKAGLQ